MAERITGIVGHRIDTAANLSLDNPILIIGEIGIESDTNKSKYGDGVSVWSDLNYSETGDLNGDLNVAGDIVATNISATIVNANINAVTIDATTVNANIDATTVDATTVNATTVNATTVNANIDATTVDATTVNATTVNANIDATTVDATTVTATGVISCSDPVVGANVVTKDYGDTNYLATGVFQPYPSTKTTTGSSSTTVFPIGTIVSVLFGGVSSIGYNATITPRRNGSATYYSNTSGTLLSGTWRSRGTTHIGTTNKIYLVQRVL